LKVTFIIPAHNAAETLAETLQSVQAQTRPDWEAVVVDDGSTDGTAAVAARFAREDARIRLVRRSQGGEGAARNTGIAAARHDWVAFLDADDWVLPHYLERLTAALGGDPGLAAVHCGWTRVTPGGLSGPEQFCPPEDDLFPHFARYNALAVHACLVRRSLAEAIDGFDASLRTCPDWDFWQRLSRTRARFGAVREVLARYRMRPTSSGTRALQVLVDGLRVITRGHAPDPGVANPHPAHAGGMPRQELAGARLNFLCWPAGIALGQGADPRPFLAHVGEEHDPDLDPAGIASMLFFGVLLAECRLPGEWDQVWPNVEGRLQEFLLALEEHALAPGLARRARLLLERRILDHSLRPRPLTIGATHAIDLELTRPPADVRLPAGTERLLCSVTRAGAPVGVLELPVLGEVVAADGIARAVAEEYPESSPVQPPAPTAAPPEPQGGRRLRNGLKRAAKHLLPYAARHWLRTHWRATVPVTTERLPILMYHRVAPTGCAKAARYRVTPEGFAEQMRCLYDTGYRTASLREWQAAAAARRPLPSRAVVLTFDDGYHDFLLHAWPVLRRFGFSAVVFLVSEHIGGCNGWDWRYGYGEDVPLLGWPDIRRLQRKGIEFGSHTLTHPRLTALSPREILHEGLQSRVILEKGLGRPVTAFAYPHGAQDRTVQRLIAACGYTFGLTCWHGLAGPGDRLIALPRLEITGFEALPEFRAKIGLAAPAHAA
jgi:peptidoglycan/xylan/chitin deacetylase (PgdA/CDA1 family)